MTTRNPLFKDSFLAIIVSLIVAIFAAYAYGLFNSERWDVPPGYVSGDGYWSLNLMKSAASGELAPLKPCVLQNLGAPYRADYSDWPLGLAIEFMPAGLLIKAFGLSIGSNLYLLLCHIAAGLSMFICLRFMGAKRLWASVAALGFGLSPFLFYRGLAHTMLANIVFLVPIVCAAAWYLFHKPLEFHRRSVFWFFSAFSFFIGNQILYFSAPYLWVLLGASLVWAIRSKKILTLIPYMVNGVFFIVGFIVSNLPYFLNSLKNGGNSQVVVSEYQHLQWAALRPIEMFLPGSGSGMPILDLVSRFHENRDFFRLNIGASESMSAYLGLLGCISFLLLVGTTLYYAATNRQSRISGWFWFAIFLIAFSIVSGLNNILGLGGVYVLRSANRYSIFIAAVALIFLALFLSANSKKLSHWKQVLLAMALLAIPCIETILPRLRGAELHRHVEDVVFWKKGSNQWESRAASYQSDVEFAKKLEAALPAGSMVFNLPIIDLPSPGAYTFYRPTYFTENIRYSFGNIHGRAKDSWLKSIQNLSPEEMISKLQGYGFSGILVYYGENIPEKHNKEAERILLSLQAKNLPVIKSPAGDFTFFELRPDPHPEFPAVSPFFATHWWNEKAQPASANLPPPGDNALRRWTSRKKATLEVFNEKNDARDFVLSGEVLGMADSKFEILNGSEIVYSGIVSTVKNTQFSTQPIQVNPQSSLRLVMKTESKPAVADGLKFNFGVSNLELKWLSESP